MSGWLAIHAGDVVVFRDPEAPSIWLVKRVASLAPGGAVLVRGDNPNVSRDSRHFGDGAVWIGDVLQYEQGKSGVEGGVGKGQRMSRSHCKFSTWAWCGLPSERHIVGDGVHSIDSDCPT